MPDTAIGARDIEPDTTGQGVAADTLGTEAAPPPGGVIPPKVTLTIEFGTLNPETVKAISDFVMHALTTGPSAAVAKTGSRGIQADEHGRAKETGAADGKSTGEAKGQ